MKLRAIVAVLLLATTCTGCLGVAVAGVAAAVGYVKYENNEARSDFEVGLEEAWVATRKVLQGRGLVVEGDSESRPGEDTEEIEVESDEVVVRLQRRPSDRVRIRVRTGTFETEGNKRNSGLVLEEIAGVLGVMPVPPGE